MFLIISILPCKDTTKIRITQIKPWFYRYLTQIFLVEVWPLVFNENDDTYQYYQNRYSPKSKGQEGKEEIPQIFNRLTHTQQEFKLNIITYCRKGTS